LGISGISFHYFSTSLCSFIAKKKSNDNHDVVRRFDFAEITQDSDFAFLGIGGNARCVDKVGAVDASNFGKWARLRRLVTGSLLV
jgi:hypothetical protein